MRCVGVLICSGVLTALLFGCAPRESRVQGPPEIFSLARVNGKGIPYGRSDTDDGYFPLSRMATDMSYGFAADNPVKIGGTLKQGPILEQAYLNGLRGPSGQPIEYERIGTCCPFQTPKGWMGTGFLDAYLVTYVGQAAPMTIYINVYDEGQPMVPVGLTPRKIGQ